MYGTVLGPSVEGTARIAGSEEGINTLFLRRYGLLERIRRLVLRTRAVESTILELTPKP